jgi:hypothetical protein
MSGKVTGSAFCARATAIAGSDSGIVQLWQTADQTPVGPPLRHGCVVTAVTSWGDGRGFLTASGREVALWRDPLAHGPATAGLSRRRVEACAGTVLQADGLFRPLSCNDLKAALVGE